MITHNENGQGRRRKKGPELRSAASIQPITVQAHKNTPLTPSESTANHSREDRHTQGKRRERGKERTTRQSKRRGRVEGGRKQRTGEEGEIKEKQGERGDRDNKTKGKRALKK